MDPMDFYEEDDGRTLEALGLGGAWQHYSVSTRLDGRVLVLVKTNDDNDDGFDDGVVSEWEETFDSLEAALKYTGRSRVGVSGISVVVTVDGERV